MRLWKWFCRLGVKVSAPETSFWRNRQREVKPAISGVEVCTRLCGQAGCRCGGTIRGLHCIWSYYRDK
ncbi:hypothetical protein SRRS_36380 [Sporomusa rhizae]